MVREAGLHCHFDGGRYGDHHVGLHVLLYPRKRVNIAVFVGATIVFVGSLWLVRSQVTVGDTFYMRAMIPHHCIAIMTSGRANILDPRVRKMANEIIYAQNKETAEMRYLVGNIKDGGISTDLPDLDPAEIMSFEQALATAEVAKLDPEFMTDEDVAHLFPQGAICRFSYTADNPPVFIASEQPAQLKISGDRELRWDNNSSFVAEGVQITVAMPNGRPVDASGGVVDAQLTTALVLGLRNGYREKL